MDNAISRAEHEEFARRMDAENKRLHKRIETVEEVSNQINDLAISIKELTVEVKNLTEKQNGFNERLDEIEGRDGEKWRQITQYCLTLVIGAAAGYLANFLF